MKKLPGGHRCSTYIFLLLGMCFFILGCCFSVHGETDTGKTGQGSSGSYGHKQKDRKYLAGKELLEKFYSKDITVYHVVWADLLGYGGEKEFFASFKLNNKFCSSVFSTRRNKLIRIGYFEDTHDYPNFGNSAKVLSYNKKNYFFIYTAFGTNSDITGVVFGWHGDMEGLKEIAYLDSHHVALKLLPGGKLAYSDYCDKNILEIDQNETARWEEYKLDPASLKIQGKLLLEIHPNPKRGLQFSIDGKKISLVEKEVGLVVSDKEFSISRTQGVFMDIDAGLNLFFSSENFENNDYFEDLVPTHEGPALVEFSEKYMGPPLYRIRFMITK